MLTLPTCPTPFAAFHFFLLLIFFSFFMDSNIHACNHLDRRSLISFSLVFSPPPSPPLNWSSSADCCLWEGVSCDSGNRVTRLWLPSRGLAGSLSPAVGNLTRLAHLSLSGNTLRGPLPTGFFSSLNRLQILDLHSNRLDGDLASYVSSAELPASMQVLDLSDNNFQGAIHSSFLRSARSLLGFNVSNNRFTGLMPSSFCIHSMNNVKLLDFSFNNFSGQIPVGFGRCSKLEVFNAGFNSISGPIPDDIYNASALREFSLPFNWLTGGINGAGLVHLTNLTVLEFYYNQLTGTLPPHIGKLSCLESLLLHSNNFSGTLPPSMMSCNNLIKLSLRSNFFEGNLSSFDFSKLLRLRVLDLGINNFSGQIPVTLYSCKSLRAVRLSYNQLEGKILPDVLSLQSLSFLAISHNKLTNVSEAIRILMGCKNLTVLILAKNFVGEKIPDDTIFLPSDGLKNLQTFVLSVCQLSGRVPTWLASLGKLEILDLSFNQLQGSIPGWLGSLPRLFYIDLSGNRLSGEFPEELTESLSLTSEEAAAEADNTSLDLPLFFSRAMTPLYNARNLLYNRLSNLPPALYLANNTLSGKIPVKIGGMKLLHMLDLSHNHFSGNIPDELSELRNLERLDLSGNHLSGEIPPSLGSLSFLSEFNVSYNNLRGPIPSSTQLQSFGASVYEGNSGLCGLPLPDPCSRSPVGVTNEEDEGDEHGNRWIYVSVSSGFVTGFSVVCFTLGLERSWRNAYFQFLTEIKNKIYVRFAVFVATVKMRAER